MMIRDASSLLSNNKITISIVYSDEAKEQSWRNKRKIKKTLNFIVRNVDSIPVTLIMSLFITSLSHQKLFNFTFIKFVKKILKKYSCTKFTWNFLQVRWLKEHDTSKMLIITGKEVNLIILSFDNPFKYCPAAKGFSLRYEISLH